MAEIAGLTFGAVSLAGLFTTCVDCFEAVQLGRNFGADYERSLLKLRIVQLRLSRWGESVNILGNPSDVGQEVAVQWNTHQEDVKRLLGQIMGAFQEAKIKSEKYTLKSRSGDELLPPQNNGNETLLSLCRKFQAVTIRRQKRTGFTKKAAWALYGKKNFDELISTVAFFVDGLGDLFPAARERQQKLSEIEVSEVTSESDEQGSLLLLKDTTGNVDKILQEAVAKAIQKSQGHSYKDMSATGKSALMMGDHIVDAAQFTGRGSHSFQGVRTTDNAVAQAGDIFGGPSIFDRLR